MSEHWCTYCRGVNAHNCQFNAAWQRHHTYVTNTTAQAVPVLTESELRSILQGTNHMVKNAMHGAFWPELEEACRAIEQAVRAKMGAAVPMTHMQIVTLWGHRSDGPSTPEIVSFARLVERHHGIVGKEDGNV